MQVEEFLEATARRFPDKIAVAAGEHRLTYAELTSRVRRLAGGLVKAGVGRGERVAIVLENSVDAVVAIFAVLKAGAVFVMLNPTIKSEKLTGVLNNCRGAALIAYARTVEALRAGGHETPHLRVVVLAGSEPARPGPDLPRLLAWDALVRPEQDSAIPGPKCIDVDLAALLYTSGSTGKPKGVMMTHLNLTSITQSIITYLELTSDDTILNVLPLSFGYGLTQVLMSAFMGCTLILERSFAYPAAILDRMTKERVTGFPLVSSISAILLQMDLRKWDLSRLRYITSAAAMLPVEHIRKLRELLPHMKIYSMYGLTECMRVTYLPPEQIDIRPSSVGKGMPNEQVYIVDEKGEEVGPGVTGELVIRGSNVMKGYWEAPEETARALRDGPYPWEKVLYSGDLFRMDEEGYLYFVARKDDIIKTRGEKVSPREVEDVLYGLPEVAEAAVVGVPDEILGSAIKAVLTLRNGATLSEQTVQRYCREHLEDFMVPKFVEFREELPKTTSGKIARRELGVSGGSSS